MKLSKLASLVGQNARRSKASLVFSAIGIVVGISSLVFFIGLGLGVRQVLLERIFPVAADEIELIAPTMTVDGARFTRPSLFGPSGLTDDQLAALRRLPDVKEVYPMMNLAVPAMAEGVFHMGKGSRRAVGDVAVRGVDPALVQGDVVEGASFGLRPEGEPIPALVSDKLLEMYNANLAKAHGLPKITRSMILGLSSMVECKIHFGRSFMGQSRSRLEDQPCQIVGFSSRSELLGGAIPLDYVRRLNREFNDGKEPSYDRFVVRALSPAHVAAATAAARDLGLEVDDSAKSQAESVGVAVALVIALLGLISLIIVAVAAINIAHTFYMVVYERKRELAILRALGAARGDIRALILSEALAVGLVGGVMGTALAFLLGWSCDLLAERYLPDFPFKPETYFLFPPWLLLTALGCAMLFCLAGAIFPAARAARMSPAQALVHH